MLDSVEGPVHHLAYERGEDVIVMKGYKFAKAKTAAAATLGCLALANPAVASYLVQVAQPHHSLATIPLKFSCNSICSWLSLIGPFSWVILQHCSCSTLFTFWPSLFMAL